MSQVPAYAPTSSYSSITPAASIPLDEEVKLHTSIKEREIYESLAEIHAIILSLDFLEKAVLRDSVSHEEYTPTCLRLIAQYNGILKNELVAEQFKSLEDFKEKYGLEYELGIGRLKVGVPVTVENAMNNSDLLEKDSDTTDNNNKNNSSNNNSNNNNNNNNNNNTVKSAKAIAEITGNFITCMDAVKLNYKAKDQLHPLLSELMTSLNRMDSSIFDSSSGGGFQGRGKLVQWLITLNELKINEEISDDQARQLLFDLDNAYKEFYTSLE